MDKNTAGTQNQEKHEVPALQDLNDMQLALIGGGIGETIL